MLNDALTWFLWTRFLHYTQVGGFLPPHTDLSRTDTTGRTSTHTFLLYMAGNDSRPYLLPYLLYMVSHKPHNPL